MPHGVSWADAKWSPDASKAAWIETDDEDSGRLMLAEPEGEPRQLGPEGSAALFCGPLIIFEFWPGKNGKALDAYIIDVDTGSVEPLTLNGLPVDWTLTNNLVIWEKTSEKDAHARKVVLMKPDGSDRRVLGDIQMPWEGPLPELVFSPDSDWLAWGGTVRSDRWLGVGDTALRIVRAEGRYAMDFSIVVARWKANSVESGRPDSNSGNGGLGRQVVAEGQKPSWSPDGSRVAYVRLEDNLYTLYALSLESGSEVKVVDIENVLYVDGQIAWSTDGRNSRTAPNQREKRSLHARYRERRVGALAGHPYLYISGSLTRDGSAVIAYSTSSGLTAYELDGTSRPIRPAGSGDRCSEWSRDGTLMLCAGRSGLYTVEIATGNIERLLEGYTDSAAWSPDESSIAFAQNVGKHRLGV